MDPTIFLYSASIFATMLAVSTFSVLGTWEIEAQSIPPYLTDQGYTPAIFVNQVTDAVTSIQRETAAQSTVDIVIDGRVTPVGEIASYFGLRDVVRASQTAIGLAPPRIQIEIVQRDDMAYWLVRGPHVIRGDTVVSGQAKIEEVEPLLKHIAHTAISFISPFQATGYDLILDSRAGNYELTIEKISDLLVECEDSKSYACSDRNKQLGLIIRAVAYLNSNEYGSAFGDLSEVNRIDGGNALATAFLGDAYLKLEKTELAAQTYQRALTLDSAIAERFRDLANGFAETNNVELAIERFNTAAALGAEGAGFLAEWAKSLADAGDLEAALEKYMAAEAIDPDDAPFSERISDLREKMSGVGSDKPGEPKARDPDALSEPTTPAPDASGTDSPAKTE